MNILHKNGTGLLTYGSGDSLQGAMLYKARLKGADLRGADLQRACLEGADLRGACLEGADLREADLRRVNCQNLREGIPGVDYGGVRFRWADLTGVDLTGADLTGADFRQAKLRGATFTGAKLTGANLWGATLRGVNLQLADLQGIHEELLRVLDSAHTEVPALRATLRRGRYTGGCDRIFEAVASGPGLIERFWGAVKPADTPATHPIAAIILQWVEEWIAKTEEPSDS